MNRSRPPLLIVTAIVVFVGLVAGLFAMFVPRGGQDLGGPVRVLTVSGATSAPTSPSGTNTGSATNTATGTATATPGASRTPSTVPNAALARSGDDDTRSTTARRAAPAPSATAAPRPSSRSTPRAPAPRAVAPAPSPR
ncbi:MAG: hypothetical protein Q4G51_17440, partial [Dermatophilus congolensis]|nr:hypothetical protein [Dermatophilus congolensis]